VSENRSSKCVCVWFCNMDYAWKVDLTPAGSICTSQEHVKSPFSVFIHLAARLEANVEL
jgi:hypothetical protein